MTESVDETLHRLGVDPSAGLSALEVDKRANEYGPNALAEESRSLLKTVGAFFWGPIPWMIEAAAIMSLVLEDWGDFAIIMVLLVFNAALGFWEQHQASNALDALKGSLAPEARALRDAAWNQVAASTLVPGDIVRLRLGDVVPADTLLLEGDYLSIDEAALTGESLPVTKSVGDQAYSGSIVKQGEMVAVVTAIGTDTFFGKTAKLVQSAGATSHFQKAVLRIGDFLIIVALALAVVLIIDQLVGMRGHFNHDDLLRLAEFVLILLVASVPVAMPAVLSITMALGAQMLAKKKAIVSRLESIEELAGIDILCSDKTGTLTENKLTLGDTTPHGGASADDVVLAGALASKVEDADPIDLAVVRGLTEQGALSDYEQTDFVPFDPIKKRTEARVRRRDGSEFHVSKGAPQVILDLAGLSNGDRAAVDSRIDELAAAGYRTLGVARSTDGNDWQFLGLLSLSDPPRADSGTTIENAREYGVDIKMVTGDDVAIAREIAGQLGLGQNIVPAATLFPPEGGGAPPDLAESVYGADGFARVFPEHKFAIVKTLQEAGHITGMTGDGVNDAPALKQADVGVAVSGATEAARAAADLILTAPGLSVIVDGLEEARRIFQRMLSYTLYRIAMTIDIMVFVVAATIAYDFFPLTPVMIIALALLDDVPIMLIAFDNADVAPKPVRWDMHRTLLISSALGLLAVVQSFGLLYIGDTVYGLARAELQTMMFLQLVVGGHLMLFVTRTPHAFWKRPRPNLRLLAAIVATQILAALICGFGWLVSPLSWVMVGLVWLYNVPWMLLQDAVKLGLARSLDRRHGHRVGASA
ncbi:MAG: plasma-membrane proton-efflux P-type ATPase [Myxococcota bacterium]